MEKLKIIIKEFAIIVCGGILGYVLGYITYSILYADMIAQAKTETSYLLKILLDIEIKESKEVYTVYGSMIGMGVALMIPAFFQQIEKD